MVEEIEKDSLLRFKAATGKIETMRAFIISVRKGVMMNRCSIAEAIAENRKIKKLTQEQLGEKLGVSGQAVSKWESGATMPDVMLLPNLCDILEITLETLLGVQTAVKEKNLIADFCKYARSIGTGTAICKVIAQLSDEKSDGQGESEAFLGPELIRANDKHGMGFVISGTKYQDTCIQMENRDIAYFLRVLADEGCLSVLKLIGLNQAITREELCGKLEMDEERVTRILLGLMKRDLICVSIDRDGKQGYQQSANMIGAWLVLAGCHVAGCGSTTRDHIRIERKE